MQLNEVVQEEIKAVIDAANKEIRKAWLQSAQKVSQLEKDLNMVNSDGSDDSDPDHVSEAN
jgi:hypothetical protein